MKTKYTGKVNIVEGGKEFLEDTNEFKRKVEEVNREIREKYSPALLDEKNWIKKLR